MSELLEGVDYPLTGWRVDGKLIHPPQAYTRAEDWFSHFEATLPDRAKRMREYSRKQGWGKHLHQKAWTEVALGWLRKNAPSNARSEPTEPLAASPATGGSDVE